MISDEGDKLLKENLAVLHQLRQMGQIDDDKYFKGVVCIAYEYAVNDSIASAIALLAMVPEAYYKLVQPTQVLEDGVYWEVASELARLLVAKGYAGLESDDCRPTQAPARA